VTFDWLNLRSIGGSQQLGLEEPCCQLAKHEAPGGTRFIRKGLPDAGIECYAIFADDQEWGWWAKYFTKRPDSTQWQLDSSAGSERWYRQRIR
jgi:hypothetical protein